MSTELAIKIQAVKFNLWLPLSYEMIHSIDPSNKLSTCVASVEFAAAVDEIALHRIQRLAALKVPKHQSPNVLSLTWEDVEVGRLIGKGSFSTVRKAYLKQDPENTVYALKSPTSESENEDHHGFGMIDMMVEASVLSQLSHDNIVRLVGVMPGISLRSCRTDLFLLEEMLVETLDKRIAQWADQDDVLKSRHRPFKRKSSGRLEGLVCRLRTAAIGIARGMEYLHEHGVIFRDLKPQNIGFAEDGTVKIFDFGLAREIGGYSSKAGGLDEMDACSPTEKPTMERRMTGQCGTPRYMAPEVGKCHDHYGLPADVYSFAILLWEILTLKKPFSHIDSLMKFHQDVFNYGWRPSLKSIWSSRLRDLLKNSWDTSAGLRPTFSEICVVLDNEVNLLDLALKATKFKDRTGSDRATGTGTMSMSKGKVRGERSLGFLACQMSDSDLLCWSHRKGRRSRASTKASDTDKFAPEPKPYPASVAGSGHMRGHRSRSQSGVAKSERRDAETSTLEGSSPAGEDSEFFC